MKQEVAILASRARFAVLSIERMHEGGLAIPDPELRAHILTALNAVKRVETYLETRLEGK